VTDDELLARLRAADPAASLPPADPSRVARLLEDAMSDDLSTESRAVESRATESRATGARGRGPLTWLVAAAAVLLIVGGGAFGVARLGLGTGTGGAGDDAAVRTDDRPTATRLRAPAAQAYTARCMIPSAETLAQQSVAFEGTVDEISEGLVSLMPTRWYHGKPSDTVLVESPAPQLTDLIGAARFEVGQRYLVSATGGVVTVCGHTAPYSAGLARLYAEAFPA